MNDEAVAEAKNMLKQSSKVIGLTKSSNIAGLLRQSETAQRAFSKELSIRQLSNRPHQFAATQPYLRFHCGIKGDRQFSYWRRQYCCPCAGLLLRTPLSTIWLGSVGVLPALC